MISSVTRLTLILLSLALCSCGALYLTPARFGERVSLAQNGSPPTAVVRVMWSKSLVGKPPLLLYKPQEFATPAIGAIGEDVVIYVGSSYKVFYALRQRTGEVVWSRQLTGAISSEPLYLPKGTLGPDPMVLLGDDDGALTAMDARTGEVRWTYRVRGPIRVRPTFSAGSVYFTSGEGRLYAVDAKTGAWRWQYEREVPESFTIRGGSGALCASGRVYAGFPDGYLAALNAATGEVVWTRQLSGDASRFTDVDSTPVLVGDTLYVSSYATGAFALDVKDGSVRWRYDLEGAGPVNVDPATGRIYVAASEAGIHCLDPQGRLLWRQSLAQQGELSFPTLWGPYLLLSAAVGGMYLVEAATGHLLQYFDPGQGVTGRPVAQGTGVFLLANGGAVFALTAS